MHIERDGKYKRITCCVHKLYLSKFLCVYATAAHRLAYASVAEYAHTQTFFFIDEGSMGTTPNVIPGNDLHFHPNKTRFPHIPMGNSSPG